MRQHDGRVRVLVYICRHVMVPSMRAARPSGTMRLVIRATETGSGRFRSYPQARRSKDRSACAAAASCAAMATGRQVLPFLPLPGVRSLRSWPRIKPRSAPDEARISRCQRDDPGGDPRFTARQGAARQGHHVRRALLRHDLDGAPSGPDSRVGPGVPGLCHRAGPTERHAAKRRVGRSLTGPLGTTWARLAQAGVIGHILILNALHDMVGVHRSHPLSAQQHQQERFTVCTPCDIAGWLAAHAKSRGYYGSCAHPRRPARLSVQGA
jgi:hypothetical protein